MDEAIVAAVDEAGVMLRADGADLVLVDADPKMARIQLRLVLEGANCEDCVLPPDHLQEVISTMIQGKLGEYEVVLDDPRRSLA